MSADAYAGQQGLDAASPRRALGMLGAMPIIAILVIAIGLAAGVRGDHVTMLCLAVFSAAVAFLPLSFDQARPAARRHVLLDMLAVMFTAYFVVPVFTQYVGATGPVDPSGMAGAGVYPADIVRGQLMALLGLTSLLLGYATPAGSLLSSVLPPPRHDWKPGATLFASVVLISLGWMLWAGFQLGLVPTFLGSGFLGGFSDATLWGAGLLTVAYVRHRSPAALAFLVVLVTVTSFFNFFTGSKRRFLTPPVMIVLSWIVMKRRIRTRWILLGILTLILLYPVSQFYREVVTAYRTKSAVQILANPVPALLAMGRFVGGSDPAQYLLEGIAATGNRLDALGRTSVVVRDTPGLVPYQDGWTLKLIAVAYIPRVLWPDKPDITIGQWITDNYGGGAIGADIDARVGPSWIGEFYLNFGTPGVVLGMLSLGILFRFAHEHFFRKGVTIPATVAGVIVLYQLMTSVGGGLVAILNKPVFAILPIVFMHIGLRILGGTTRIDLEAAAEDTAAGSAVARP